jgi:hypothetical protein
MLLLFRTEVNAISWDESYLYDSNFSKLIQKMREPWFQPPFARTQILAASTFELAKSTTVLFALPEHNVTLTLPNQLRPKASLSNCQE